MDAQTRSDPINLLSVDLEDWPQSTLDQDLEISPRVATSTRRLLEMFARHGARATFFVLGLVAERFPGLIREVRDAGHEVATHGTSHRSVAALGPDGFRADLRRSIRAIEDAAGVQVLGYRAPDFSISERELWALPVLSEEGLAYDSSIFPFRGRRYGIPAAFRAPCVVRCPGGRRLLEFPLATAACRSREVAISGCCRTP
jgi:polysaccharide deacetylase family protein (PEP-CTERM system associated)